MIESAPDSLLRSLFDAAVDAARPETCLAPYLTAFDDRPVTVIAAGKAAGMAVVAEAVLPYAEGLSVTRHGSGRSLSRFEAVEAAHPVPDQSSVRAARRALSLADGLGEGDTLLVLLSGGASSFLCAPAAGLTLKDKQAVTAALLRAGASIDEINTVRKHLSAIKGGHLAARAFPARTVTLAISDVVGDDPAVIGSGPTVGDPSTLEEARDVLARYGIAPSVAVRHHLSAALSETPKPDDPRLARTEYRLIATPGDALEAAAQAARAAGLEPVLLGDAVEGEAGAVARAHADLALNYATAGTPAVLLSGGELTVALGARSGVGGPNQHYALALAQALDGARGIWAIACDTDGCDGVPVQGRDIAGAMIGPGTLTRARNKGLDPATALARHDAGAFFAALGDGVVTGPTGTNVNDFRAILIDPSFAE